MADEATKPAETAEKKVQPHVKLDMAQLKSSYCNVANVTSHPRRGGLNFGTNQNWDLGQKAMDVELAAPA